jgi:hypothetical protein
MKHLGTIKTCLSHTGQPELVVDRWASAGEREHITNAERTILLKETDAVRES